MLGTMKLFTSGASPPTTIGIPTPSMISKTTTAVAILTTSTCHRFTSSDLLFGQFRGLTSSKKHGNSRSHAIPRLRKVPQELFRRARARYSSWRPVPGVEETGPAASPERFTNRFTMFLAVSTLFCPIFSAVSCVSTRMPLLLGPLTRHRAHRFKAHQRRALPHGSRAAEKGSALRLRKSATSQSIKQNAIYVIYIPRRKLTPILDQ